MCGNGKKNQRKRNKKKKVEENAEYGIFFEKPTETEKKRKKIRGNGNLRKKRNKKP
jgi:hypothetical protein